MSRLLLAGSRRARGARSLRGRRIATIEIPTRRIQVLVGELLNQTIGTIIVTHPILKSRLRGRQIGLAIMLRRLGVLLLRRVRVGHEIPLAKTSIHVILRSLVLVNRLRKGGRGGGIGAIVDSSRIESTLIVPEIQVETIVVVGIHCE